MDYDIPAILAGLDMDEEPVIAACGFGARVAELDGHGEGIAGPHLREVSSTPTSSGLKPASVPWPATGRGKYKERARHPRRSVTRDIII